MPSGLRMATAPSNPSGVLWVALCCITEAASSNTVKSVMLLPGSAAACNISPGFSFSQVSVSPSLGGSRSQLSQHQLM